VAGVGQTRLITESVITTCKDHRADRQRSRLNRYYCLQATVKICLSGNKPLALLLLAACPVSQPCDGRGKHQEPLGLWRFSAPAPVIQSRQRRQRPRRIAAETTAINSQLEIIYFLSSQLKTTYATRRFLASSVKNSWLMTGQSNHLFYDSKHVTSVALLSRFIPLFNAHTSPAWSTKAIVFSEFRNE